jgi:hypothetical protein
MVFAVLAGSFICAESVERVEALSSKVILQNENGYFVLSDRSCWKVIGYSVRWRNISEWWNGVQLVPENFVCVPNQWQLGAQIEVYSKYGHLTISEKDASNQEDLRQCTHLLVNAQTRQVLFAVALEPASCLVQLFTDAQKDGYNRGFSDGRSASYYNDKENYNRGHVDGFNAGYAAGFQEGIRR